MVIRSSLGHPTGKLTPSSGRYPALKRVPTLAPTWPTRHYGGSYLETEIPMKKLLLLAILGGIGYLVYRQYMASQAEQDLWAEATAAPDLR